uniref:Dehydrogenase/reductase SDR family member 11 n=1 Tax=Cacopsylla melanoneura TaxID=428564 RepID=A0A8D8TE43_9HEMI
MDLNRWENKVALVTGANSGIGAAITQRMLNLNLNTIAIDLNIDHLMGLKDQMDGKAQRLYPMQANLCNEEEIQRIFQWAEETIGGIDILINNAGVSGQKSLLEGSAEEWRHILDVNVVALSVCTREAVKSMERRNVTDGHIIHLSSNVAHLVPRLPALHFYSASKHAVRALTEGLRQELRNINSKIKITSISPGLVKSQIFKSSLGDKFDKSLYESHPSLQADDIANTIEFILSSPSHVQLHDIIIKPQGSDG